VGSGIIIRRYGAIPPENPSKSLPVLFPLEAERNLATALLVTAVTIIAYAYVAADILISISAISNGNTHTFSPGGMT